MSTRTFRVLYYQLEFPTPENLNGSREIPGGSGYEKSIRKTRFLARGLVHCPSCSVVLSSSRESSLFPFIFRRLTSHFKDTLFPFISFFQMASKKETQIGIIDCTGTDKWSYRSWRFSSTKVMDICHPRRPLSVEFANVFVIGEDFPYENPLVRK